MEGRGESSSSPKLFNNLTEHQIEEWSYQFIKGYCINQIISILRIKSGSDEEQLHYPVTFRYLWLLEEYPQLGECILQHPEKVLAIFNKSAKRVLIETYLDFKDNQGKTSKSATASNKFAVYVEDEGPTRPKTTASSSSEEINMDFKSKLNLHVRVHSLPICAELTRTVFPGCNETGVLLCLLGTVTRAGTPKLQEYSKSYRCNKCKELVEVEAPPSRYHTFPKSVQCPNQCDNAKVSPLVAEDKNLKDGSGFSKVRDYQELKLQEQISKTDFGSMPKVITGVLEDDLVNSCKPGDDVAITGFLYLRWKPFKPGFPIESQLVFKAVHVQVNNDQRVSIMITDETIKFFEDFWEQHELDPFEGRNVIIASFCPQMYGMYAVKLAMCMVLAGGVPREICGSKVRGECHMLLIGDPGCGKSQMLKFATMICPRSVATTGIGTSSAGLTVSAVKENGEWHLEAGALVLADGGICCIDEFSYIKEQDRTSIHEAMEQQTISIAKAGMVVKIPTRCTIIAACNPQGKYDTDENVACNSGIAGPLLSRFDVVMVLSDAQDDDWDSLMADFILEGKDSVVESIEEAHRVNEIWDMGRLQSYLVIVKDLKPVMTPEANEVISEYYQYQRRLEDRNPARTTVRLLESLRRLSEAHAKLMFRKQVILYDAITAISVMEVSMQTPSIDERIANGAKTAFPEDAMEEYRGQAKQILTRLGLEELWQREKEELDQMEIERAAKKNGLSVSGPSQRPSTSSSCNSSSRIRHPGAAPFTGNPNEIISSTPLPRNERVVFQFLDDNLPNVNEPSTSDLNLNPEPDRIDLDRSLSPFSINFSTFSDDEENELSPPSKKRKKDSNVVISFFE